MSGASRPYSEVLALMAEHVTGHAPLYVAADEATGQAIVVHAAPSGLGVILTVVDPDSDIAAVKLTRETVTSVRDVLTEWLER